jgi:hypothetical protein
MDDLTLRNFLSVQQSVSSMESRMQEQQIVVMKLQESINNLSILLSRLEQSVISLQAKNLIYGNGPTVR